ncbi:MAG: PAS domain S-box protein, partial [Anaerolineae bacterium]|nr:PAS domain S-box protein [Anaerolineae bacterium]
MAANRLLLVEDEGIVAMDLSNRLRKLGYVVVGAVSTGEEAVQAVRETLPDLVLMDISLAGAMDGIRAASFICSCFDLPVVYLTAYSDPAILDRAKQTSPYGYVVKPVTDPELHTTIEIALHKHQIDLKLRQMNASLLAEIEERQRAQQALQESKRMFEKTFASLRDAAFIIQAERGAIVDVNPAAIQMFGYSREEFIGRNIGDLHPYRRGYADPLLALAPLIKKRGFIHLPELTLKRKGGSLVVAEQTVTAFDDENGANTTWVCVIRDITERKDAELALVRSEQNVRRVLENLPVMVAAYNPNGTIAVWNRECERVTGYTAEEMLNNPHAIEMLCPDPVYREMQLSEWKRRGHNFREWEWKFTCKDGLTRTVSWSNLPAQFSVPGGAFWASGVDITARLSAERRLRDHAERLAAMLDLDRAILADKA